MKWSSLLLFLSLLWITYGCGNTAAHTAPPPVEEVVVEEPVIEIDSNFTIDYVRGRFDPRKHPDFVAVAAKYTDGDGTYYLRQDTYEAFQDMHAAAAADGVRLVIISATRNFARQKMIWEQNALYHLGMT